MLFTVLQALVQALQKILNHLILITTIKQLLLPSFIRIWRLEWKSNCPKSYIFAAI